MPSRELYQKVKVEVGKAMQEPRTDVMQLPHAIAETHQVCWNGQKRLAARTIKKKQYLKKAANMFGLETEQASRETEQLSPQHV